MTEIKYKNASAKRGYVNEDIRMQTRDDILKSLFLGEITQGQALRKLRISILGINQQRYTQLVNVSRQTLSNIENDKGNYSVETINQVFKPFGLMLMLVPKNKL